MADQNSMQKLKEMFRGKTNRLFVIGLGLILLIRVFIFFNESGTLDNTMAEPQQKPKPQAKITQKDPDYQSVSKMTQRWKDFKDSDYWVLANANMFDPKLAMDAQKIEQRATEIYQSANGAYKQGNYPQALKLLEQALSLMPSHIRAQKLKKEISDLTTKPEETVTATPTPKGTPGRPLAPSR